VGSAEFDDISASSTLSLPDPLSAFYVGPMLPLREASVYFQCLKLNGS
jgi:hypothetical protein